MTALPSTCTVSAFRFHQRAGRGGLCDPHHRYNHYQITLFTTKAEPSTAPYVIWFEGYSL